MKKSVMIIFLAVLNITLVSACELGATMINQDPYPAIPGDYVKLVFQVTGVDNPECNKISFELVEKYPIIFDPEDSPKIEVISGIYQRDYSSFLLAPYKVRIDKNALNGENEIEVKFGSKNISTDYKLKKFNIEVENSIADFEVHINDYSYSTNELTIEILNVAESDVEALTIEIPKQDNIDIRGTNRVVVGDLDSNEYTTADFKAEIEDGEIEIKIIYTDQTGIRRELIKNATFDSSYFAARAGDKQNIPTSYIVIGAITVAIVIWWALRNRNKKKERARRRGTARL